MPLQSRRIPHQQVSQLKQQPRIIFEHSQQDFLGRQRFGIQMRQQRGAAIPAVIIKRLQQFLDAIGLRHLFAEAVTPLRGIPLQKSRAGVARFQRLDGYFTRQATDQLLDWRSVLLQLSTRAVGEQS